MTGSPWCTSYAGDQYQYLEIRGDIDREAIDLIADRHIPGFDEIGINNPQWPEGLPGLLLLLISYYIFDREDLLDE